MFTFETRQDAWRIIGLGVASFLAILPLCAWRHLDIIERDLFERSQGALYEARIDGLEIIVNGRDLMLIASADDPRATRALQIMKEVYGVRKVSLKGADSAAGSGD